MIFGKACFLKKRIIIVKCWRLAASTPLFPILLLMAVFSLETLKPSHGGPYVWEISYGEIMAGYSIF